MDGPFYNDIREPILIADAGQVTLASTNKALLTAGQLPTLGANYFGRIGKKIRMRGFGKISTILTPGNGQFAWYWGTGADANGTIIGSSQAFALTASQTNLSWEFDIVVTCRGVGAVATGLLDLTGHVFMNEAVAAPHQLVPASAAAAVAVDLTVANVISPQFNRSGSTVEVMTLQEFEFIALN